MVFHINGKDYTVTPLGIDAGLKVAGVVGGTDKSYNKKPAEDLFKLVLGDVWEEMRADGVPLEAAWRAGMAMVIDNKEGRVAAEAIWDTGLPEALAAQMAANQNPAGSTRSRSTAPAGKTPSRVRTSSTTSHQGTQRKRPAAKANGRSRGASSSKRGNS